jgi:peptidoglycan/xylan/chitin deacetylase (PgdA/CDA1 family)
MGLVGNIRATVRRWHGGGQPVTIILLYHRVVEVTDDPQLLCVTPGHFDEHLQVMKRLGEVVRLRSLTTDLPGRPGGAVRFVVTFDDGYSDNLTHARAALERHDTPATVFVSSGFVGGTREFYWDELERLLLSGEGRVERSEVALGDERYRWTPEQRGQDRDSQSKRWDVLSESDPLPRHGLYRRLCNLLRPLDEATREQVLVQLRAWAGVSGVARSTHRALTEDELRKLVEGDLVEVGAHTVTHAMLSAQNAGEQQGEIARSKRGLESILGRTVDGFSYPYGSRIDFTDETVSAVKRAGFGYACANYPGAAVGGDDAYRLSRYLVRDWDGEAFERRLRGWIDG